MSAGTPRHSYTYMHHTENSHTQVSAHIHIESSFSNNLPLNIIYFFAILHCETGVQIML
jgi:hypothetical protein